MAKRVDLFDKSGYQEGPFFLYKDERNGLWFVKHIKSGFRAMGNLNGFKQKSEALTFVNLLLGWKGFNWDFKDDAEMVQKNDVDKLNKNWESVRLKY